MKRTLVSVFVLSVFAVLSNAQDDAAYTTAMKDVNGSNRALRMAVRGKDTAAASAAATKIAADFDTILAYWKAKKVDDAIAWSTTALDAAKSIAGSTDADAQAADMQKMSATCNACHMEHRGGMPPDFTIK